MGYLDFSGTIARSDLFAHGVLLTLALSVAALVLGMCVG